VVAFTFVQVISNDPGTATLVDHYDLASMNVGAGSLICGFIKWEGPATPILSITNSGAAQTWFLGTVKDNSGSNGEPHAQFFWCLSALANAALVITVNFSGANARWGRYRLVEYTATTPVLDTEVTGAQNTTGTVATTGSFSTGPAGGLMIGGGAFFTDQNFAATPPTIAGVTATIRGASSGTDTVMFTSVDTQEIGQVMVATGTASERWTINGVVFKESLGGGDQHEPFVKVLIK
jgi:hypothetical protein